MTNPSALSSDLNFMQRNPGLRLIIATSEVTSEQIADYTKKVLSYYETYAVGLPDDSAWKHGKVEHVTHGAAAVREHAERFGITGIELDVITFPLVAHDTGRLIHEHVQRSSKSQVPWRHGVESMLLAKEAFGPFSRTPLGSAMLFAIEHHSDMATPKPKEFDQSLAADALTGLIRDFDKMTGFDDAERYVSDRDFMQSQILTNFSTQRQNDPSWGEEKGGILPGAFLDERFLRGLPLERRACQSYETYMLQYLAWMFDVQNPEVTDLIIAKGGPKHVLRYILKQLEVGAPGQHAQLMTWARNWKDGALLS